MNRLPPVIDGEWLTHGGKPFKETYDEADDCFLSPDEREQQTVRRIRNYLKSVACRKPSRRICLAA